MLLAGNSAPCSDQLACYAGRPMQLEELPTSKYIINFKLFFLKEN
jgi:hypothetical protein